ncbi:MAG: FKBP-type peptidyl-prolyl cis-trans isomerase [Fusobacteriaceae bacterium]
MRIEENKVVTLDFKVFDNDTQELLEDTAELGAFFYIQGIGAFMDVIENVLEGNEKGYTSTILVSPEEGYGEYDPELVDTMNRADFEEEFDDIYEGMEFVADMDDGTEQNYVISSIEDENITVDGNHPFSGRNLRFEVIVTDVREATDEELEHGHVHFHGFEN